MLNTKNMNYYFNKQYFDGIQVEMMSNESLSITLSNERRKDSYNGCTFEERNREIEYFPFQLKDGSYRPSSVDQVVQFELTTRYPGLLMGIGNAHDLKNDDAIKCGFSFDYVSGLPYLPGSSLKGMLRSYFPDGNTEKDRAKESYIRYILDLGEIDVEGLKKNIFDYGDTFLDVFPSENNEKELLSMEFITPHNKEKFASPIPIKLIKVKPNVSFNFCFLLTEFCDDNDKTVVSKEDKLRLFKTLILDMGVGAKTNVGFGKFGEEKMASQKHESRNEIQRPYQKTQAINRSSQNVQVIPGKCESCGEPTKMNKKTGKYYTHCFKCNQRMTNG